MIEFDVETTGLQPWSDNNEAFLWIFYDGETAEAIPFKPSEYNAGPPLSPAIQDAWNRIQRWFWRGREEGIRAWNAKFDRGFAEAAGCFDVPGDGCWHDGMLLAHAVDERRSVALKSVATQLFGPDAADPQKKLKAWLNDENKRRRKIESDAKKAKVGKLKVEYDDYICNDCREPWPVAAELCAECGGFEFQHKTRKRDASEEECAAAIEEAKRYRREDGTFVYADYSDVPMSIMEPYALEDVILTRRVCDVYEAMFENMPDLKRVVEFERKSMDALFAVEKRGLPARDTEYRKLEQEVIANRERLEDKVLELAHEGDPLVYAKTMGVEVTVEETPAARVLHYEGAGGRLDEFNPNSSPQILAALKARGADLSFMSEKDGKLGADAENLRAVDDALAAAILEFRSEAKVLSTYVRPMIGRSYVSALNTYKEPFIAPDSRIHANYRQVGARTGRMSCSDPNMQNQPRDDLRLRYNIVAEPGHVLVTCDLTNIEMVLFAAYCGEGRLLNAVRAGTDLHVLTAKMLGLRDRARPGGGVETARQLGKTYNFSRIYGGGLRTIKRSFRCTMDEARLLKKRFDDAYPEVGRLQNRIDYKLQDQGFIQDQLISGRRFRVAPRDSYKATNYLVQGTAASLLKDAMATLHDDGVPMVALVHDEILAHVPVDEAQEVAALIEKRMVQAAEPGHQLWLKDDLTYAEGLSQEEQERRGRLRLLPGATDSGYPIVPLRAEADIVERWSDAKPLEDKATKKKYLFTPQWAGGEKRWVAAA
jgi:DNA polymerase I-like protein with 3'-5' exonuclease and polymerase domains